MLYYYLRDWPERQGHGSCTAVRIRHVLPHHLCAISALFASALIAWNLVPKMRAPVVVTTVIAASLVVVIGQVNLSMRRYLGHGLTLSTIHTYFDVNSVGDDSVLLSLKQDWAYVMTSLSLMGAFVVLTMVAAYRSFFSETLHPVGWRSIAGLSVAWLFLASGGFFKAYSLPPEVSLNPWQARTTPRNPGSGGHPAATQDLHRPHGGLGLARRSISRPPLSRGKGQ